MAMEDHDLNRIKRFLPVAQNLGVAPEVWPGMLHGHGQRPGTLVNRPVLQLIRGRKTSIQHGKTACKCLKTGFPNPVASLLHENDDKA